MPTQYPYQNYSLVNLPKEKWKDFPGFEDMYQISTYGRIKSLARTRQLNTPAGGEYITREKILKCKMEIKRNMTIQEDIYTIMITLSLDGIAYSYSVPRLVYYVFVEPFDLTDKTIFITYKDGDGRNIAVSNLAKSDISTIKLASYKNSRAISHFMVLSKPITQFDAEGNVVANYPSMYEAGKQNGINERSIAEVVSGKAHMYKGFFWKSGVYKRKLNLGKIERSQARDNIHTTLMKRLGIRKLNLDKVPPFLNLSTTTMEGERWKDVPGYEGLYKVSNYGRAKALQKVTVGKQQKWMPEQIQRLTVVFRIGEDGKEIAGSTYACMAKDGKKRLASVPRFVYYLFVKEFNIKDTTMRIYYKDGNTLNLHYTNLILKSAGWSINKDKG